MSIITWRRNAPLCPDLTRAARPIEWRRVGIRNGCPVYELHAWSDDGRDRWYTQGADGRWILKEQV